MRLSNTPDNPVALNGISGTSEFKIQASSKAFSILSDGLYSNKIRAIVRELSTNALDSHVEAGKADVPFDVHLPTELAPYFSIRDYGVGLSQEEVEDIYTSYFTSTKTDSDDFVGALGLGSKSPFSYTDNFSVTAIKDGIKNSYTSFITDDGIPAVALMDSSPTDETSGVEVKFSVNSDDHWTFAGEAKTVYTMFEVEPNFIGREVTVNKHKYTRENIIPGVNLREYQRWDNDNVVVMGSIEYPLEPAKETIPEELHYLFKQGLEIRLPIGLVEMSASREGLSYTPHTIKNVIKVLQDIDAGLDKDFEEITKEYDNAWDLTQKVWELRFSKLYSGAIARAIKADRIKFLRTSYSDYDKSYNIFEDALYLDTDRAAREYNVDLRHIDANYNGEAPARTPKYIGEGTKGFSVRTLSPVKFVSSGTKNIVKQVQVWARSVGKDQDILVGLVKDKNKPFLWDEFLADMAYGPPEKNLIDIDDIPKLVVDSNGQKPKNVYQLKLSGAYWDSKLSRTVVGTFDDVHEDKGKHIYIEYYMSKPHIDGKPVNLARLLRYMKDSHIPELKNAVIYGVTRTDLPRAKKSSKWIEFSAFVKKQLSGVSDEMIAKIAKSELDIDVDMLYRVIDVLDLDDDTRKFFNMKPERGYYRFNDLMEIAKHFKYTHIRDRVDTLINSVKHVGDMYPLLQYLNRDTPKELLVEYVERENAAKGE